VKEPCQKVLRLQDLAKLLGLSPCSVWRLAKRPDFPSARAIRGMGRLRVWLASDIEAWLAALPQEGSTAKAETGTPENHRKE
jgi:predicted DNA-binding transcriptional regulator AlpA